MSYFAINGVPLDNISLPEPAHNGVTQTIQDIDSSESGRNSKGKMIRDRVAKKLKWQLAFPALYRSEVAKLLNAVSGASFEFTYPDLTKESGTSTTTCYAGDRATPIYSIVNGEVLCSGVSFSVIEM